MVTELVSHDASTLYLRLTGPGSASGTAESSSPRAPAGPAKSCRAGHDGWRRAPGAAEIY